MANRRPKPSNLFCAGSSNFDPKARIQDTQAHDQVVAALERDDFASAIRSYFQIPQHDDYVYHAVTSVTLDQVQHVVSLGGRNRLHDWYAGPVPSSTSGGGEDVSTSNSEQKGRLQPLPPPPKADIDAYISLFQPSTSTPSALKALASNAKKGSLRASVAAHLASKHYILPFPASQSSLPTASSSPTATLLTIPKTTPKALATLPQNPYFTFWAWSTKNLEWCGPASPESEHRAHQHSHHLLPVLMHHFGCAVPSHESLCILRNLANSLTTSTTGSGSIDKKRSVVDMGAGNGYWTFMLRQYGLGEPGRAVAVDNGQSSWRVNWIDDLIAVKDGAEWLREKDGGKDMVLLVVYPIVGGGKEDGSFTRNLMKAFKGDTVCVVGTQNHNGYTGFQSMTMDEYMIREQPGWMKLAQVPLPSFAGKDEALFVYQRKS